MRVHTTCIYLPSNMHVNEVVTCFNAEAVRVMLDSDEGAVGLQNLFYFFLFLHLCVCVCVCDCVCACVQCPI